MSSAHFAYIHRFGKIYRVTVDNTRQRAVDYFTDLKSASNVTFIVEDREILGEMLGSDMPAQVRMIVKGLMALAGSYTGGVVNTAAGYLEAELNGQLRLAHRRTEEIYELAITSPEQAVKDLEHKQSPYQSLMIDSLLKYMTSKLLQDQLVQNDLWIHHLAAFVMHIEGILNVRSEKDLVDAGAVPMKISSDPETFPVSQRELGKHEKAYFLTLMTPRRSKPDKEYDQLRPRMPVIEEFQGELATRTRTKIKRCMLALEVDLSFGTQNHLRSRHLRGFLVREVLARKLPLDVLEARIA